MKRTIVAVFSLVFLFSAGFPAASRFQTELQKKADTFSSERPLLVLAFDTTREKKEEYTNEVFIPDTSFMGKVKKFFTRKDSGKYKTETIIRDVKVTDRLKLYSENKRKMLEVLEVSPSDIYVKSKRIFDGGDFWDIKRKAGSSIGKISVDFIAASVLPDWYYMHKKYIKDAMEIEEKVDGVTYRLIKGKMRYYVNKDTGLPAIIEYDTTEKEKKVVNKVVFGPGTFRQGKYDIVSKVSVYKNNKQIKKYNVSVLNTVEMLKDQVFDPETQTREVNRPPQKRKVPGEKTNEKVKDVRAEEIKE